MDMMPFLPVMWPFLSTRFLLVRFPLCRPIHELLPIYALVLGTKACHTTKLIISNLQRQIRLANKNISQQVYTVANVTRRCVEWEFFSFHTLPRSCNVEQSPIAMAQSILGRPRLATSLRY